MCLYPLSIKTEDSHGVSINQTVPCGKCIECLKDRQNSWKIRLTEEARDHLYVYFFTLTYNDESVPYTYDERTGERVNHVRKSDVQLWTKRHRIAYERLFKRDIDFKYFICSEYGPNTGRPHYHGILFTDVSPVFITSMFNDWRTTYGFTNFSEVGKSGKKKRNPRLQMSATMLQSIVSSPDSFGLRPNVVLTNLSKLELFPVHGIS